MVTEDLDLLVEIVADVGLHNLAGAIHLQEDLHNSAEVIMDLIHHQEDLQSLDFPTKKRVILQDLNPHFHSLSPARLQSLEMLSDLPHLKAVDGKASKVITDIKRYS